MTETMIIPIDEEKTMWKIVGLEQGRAILLREISEEVERAKRHGEKFASLHEAYAVLLEEVDEMWDITRMKRRDRDAISLRKELIQIGAMAVKALESMDQFTGGLV